MEINACRPLEGGYCANSIRSFTAHTCDYRENGYFESFNARLQDELLNGKIFYTLKEAQIVIEGWRRQHITIR